MSEIRCSHAQESSQWGPMRAKCVFVLLSCVLLCVVPTVPPCVCGVRSLV